MVKGLFCVKDLNSVNYQVFEGYTTEAQVGLLWS